MESQSHILYTYRRLDKVLHSEKHTFHNFWFSRYCRIAGNIIFLLYSRFIYCGISTDIIIISALSYKYSEIKKISQTAIIFFLIAAVPAQAGEWDAGAAVGFTVNIGNKINSAGIFVGAWVNYDFVQINAGGRICFNFKNLGTPGCYWESDSYGGALFAYGKRDSTINPFVNSVSNQTMRRYGFAYSYNIYCDGRGTSQKTGVIALQFNKISLITENDIIGDNKDRFRTAGATVQYRHESTVLGISVILWTGEKGERITGTDYPARNGYKKPERFGQYSHGILCLQAQQYLVHGQNVQASAGIDAEQVRHVFQNKIIHDMAFLPARWVKSPSSHVPMLDAEGNMYLYQPGQKIRKPAPYFNLAANPGLFY